MSTIIYGLLKNKTTSKAILKYTDVVVDKYLFGEMVSSQLLKRLKPHDTLVVANVQYLGTSVHEIIESMNMAAQYGVNLYLADENLSFKAEKLQEISSSLLLVFRLYQSLVSTRSKTALQERKAQGVKLGRPFGANPKLKLDDYREDISQMCLSGVSIKKIADKYHVCSATIYNLMHKYPELLAVRRMS